MIAAGVEPMKELGGRSPSVIASMTFMTMLHVAPWRPDFDECEQALKMPWQRSGSAFRQH